MADFLDRLIGYDIDADKLPIHQFIDYVHLVHSGVTDPPTAADGEAMFNITASDTDEVNEIIDSCDPGIDPVMVIPLMRKLICVQNMSALFRIAEKYPDVLPKQELKDILGLVEGDS